MISKHLIAAMAIAIAFLAPRLGLAQAATSFNDNFTGASDTNGWTALDGACLTAGSGAGTIPACTTLPYYSAQGTQAWVGGNSGTLPDSVGKGALRLTNGCGGSSGCSVPKGSNNFQLRLRPGRRHHLAHVRRRQRHSGHVQDLHLRGKLGR